MAATERKAITLSIPMWAYLDELARLGTHGTTAPAVASTLVEEGIRLAMEKGFLKKPTER
jgi:hypothetical protein